MPAVPPQAPPFKPPVEGDMVGAYRVEEKLGDGGFGFVYNVERAGRPFALKVIRARALEWRQNEHGRPCHLLFPSSRRQLRRHPALPKSSRPRPCQRRVAPCGACCRASSPPPWECFRCAPWPWRPCVPSRCSWWWRGCWPARVRSSSGDARPPYHRHSPRCQARRGPSYLKGGGQNAPLLVPVLSANWRLLRTRLKLERARHLLWPPPPRPLPPWLASKTPV
jgi:hypothetical protein